MSFADDDRLAGFVHFSNLGHPLALNIVHKSIFKITYNLIQCRVTIRAQMTVNNRPLPK